MLFSKGNLLVSMIASNDPHAVGLNCIRLNPDGSTVAANGNMIMAVGPVNEAAIHFPDVGERSHPGEKGSSVPLELVDKALKNLPKDKRLALQHIALTKNRDFRKVEFTAFDMQHEQRVAGLPKQEPFPPWQDSIRRAKGSGGTQICLNRSNLIELLKAISEACPDKSGENPIYIEVNPDPTIGMILRSVNRETGQRAVAAINTYDTKGQWLPDDEWEKTVFRSSAKVVKGG